MTFAWQAKRDRELRDELGGNASVKHAVKKLLEKTSGFGLQTRRRLLTRSVRMTRGVAPRVHDALDACREILGYRDPLEIYVQSSHDFQAFCAKSITAPLILGVSSRLLENFTDAELRFVMGHELGHAALDHFALPMPHTATFEDIGGKLVDRPTQLKLYLWCRAAEISADRAGLMCAQDVESSASALLKLASGVGRPGVIQTDLAAFASQLDAVIATPGACHKERFEEDVLDCFDTHPYGPLRVRALLAFSRSSLFKPENTMSAEDVERLAEADLALMEPSYLEDTSDESKLLRRTLYCVGMCVAAASGDISDEEMQALRALLGAKGVVSRETIDDLKREVDERLAETRAKASLVSRAQIVQHATIVAAADGVVSPEEQVLLDHVAAALDIDPRIIDQTLIAAAAPMD